MLTCPLSIEAIVLRSVFLTITILLDPSCPWMVLYLCRSVRDPGKPLFLLDKVELLPPLFVIVIIIVVKANFRSVTQQDLLSQITTSYVYSCIFFICSFDRVAAAECALKLKLIRTTTFALEQSISVPFWRSSVSDKWYGTVCGNRVVGSGAVFRKSAATLKLSELSR